MQPSLGLSGRVKLSVLRGGMVVHEGPWERNLWLDAGLDRLATVSICDAFSVAVKGTGATATKEDLSASANTYSITSGTSVLTRTAGTRDFTTDDIGRLIRFSTTPFQEFLITDFNSATSVDVSPNAGATVTNKKILLYYVNQVGMAAEIGRTDTYSAIAGENKTVTATADRTFTRTFIFPTEDILLDYIAATNTYTQTGTEVTLADGTRTFTSDDVGSTIHFLASGLTATILSVTLGVATVDIAQANLAQAIFLSALNPKRQLTIDGTFSRSGTTVTRASGTFVFASSDVGKIINFSTSGVEAKITAFTDTTHVTVDVSGTLAAQAITLYGFTDYSEIGFSHTLESGDNLNVRVALTSAARVYVSTGLLSSDQLKLTYELKLTVSPAVSTAGSLASVIADPGNLMSGSKAGNYAIESFATSTVTSSGESDSTFVDLEPYYDGYAALSTDLIALAPLTGKVREASVASVPMTAQAYVPGSFTKVFDGLFGLNDAIGNTWRSLMMFDPQSRSAIFTFLYAANQKKDGLHTFHISFQKVWGRDLS